jgi:dihydroorotate dehydrogenase (NAD+) catalytic subunit
MIAASGTFGYGAEYNDVEGVDVGALGGICTKGLTLEPRAGNMGERLFETPSGLLNSIGLENPGIRAFLRDTLPSMRKLGPKIIVNLSGGSVDEYEGGARLLNNADIDAVELNISCPNVKQGGMAFGLLPEAAAPVVERVSAALHAGGRPLPLIVKLSPNAADLAAVACACVNAGASALSLVNTFKAMAIDVEGGRPVFENVSAGLSGPAVRPIALRMVWELVRRVEVPVIGLGGIACVNDAREFLMAGASAVQVGTATFARPSAMNEIITGLETFMRRKGIHSVRELRI